MKLLAVFLFSSQLLCGDCDSVPDRVSLDPIPVDCADPELLEAVDFTLRKFNGDGRTRHQYALDRVSSGTVQRTRGSRYFVKFDIRESNCLVGSEKTWTECEHRPPRVANIGHCESSVYIHRARRILEVTMYNCTITPVKHPLIVPQIAPCLGCEISLSHNSSRAKEILDYSIEKFNSQSDSPNLFGSEAIFRATFQVVAGQLYTLKFSMRETGCSKSSNALWQDCPLKADIATRLYCNSTVLFSIRADIVHTSVCCSSDPIGFQAVGLTGQPTAPAPERPQGNTQRYSYRQQGSSEQPLIRESDQSIPVSLASSAPPETPSSAIDYFAAIDLLGPAPVHCPGKPWKPWRQIQPTNPVTVPPPPTQHTADHGEQPESDGLFSDFDLLADF